LLGAAPVDEVSGVAERLRRPCLALAGAAAGSGDVRRFAAGFAAGLLCSGDGAGVSAVWANAVGKMVANAIREMQASVLVMVTPSCRLSAG